MCASEEHPWAPNWPRAIHLPSRRRRDCQQRVMATTSPIAACNLPPLFVDALSASPRLTFLRQYLSVRVPSLSASSAVCTPLRLRFHRSRSRAPSHLASSSLIVPSALPRPCAAAPLISAISVVVLVLVLVHASLFWRVALEFEQKSLLSLESKAIGLETGMGAYESGSQEVGAQRAALVVHDVATCGLVARRNRGQKCSRA